MLLTNVDPATKLELGMLTTGPSVPLGAGRIAPDVTIEIGDHTFMVLGNLSVMATQDREQSWSIPEELRERLLCFMALM